MITPGITTLPASFQQVLYPQAAAPQLAPTLIPGAVVNSQIPTGYIAAPGVDPQVYGGGGAATGTTSGGGFFDKLGDLWDNLFAKNSANKEAAAAALSKDPNNQMLLQKYSEASTEADNPLKTKATIAASKQSLLDFILQHWGNR